jgi:poly-gamma-glutamate synthesis protein (capsule biosynthesis protein)
MAAACSLACAAAERKVTLLVGGDVSWSLEYKAASTVPGEADASDADWRPIPHANTVESHTKNTASYGLHFNSTTEAMRYPFRKLTPLFHSADIVFVNLETPLSDSARQVGDYRTPAAFADALHWAGVTAVSVANNHTFDDEEKGFLDTLHNLRAAGVGYVGGGYSLADARRPLILVRNGIRIGFLGYTQFSNSGDAAFAAPHLPGEAPMDPGLIKEDIEKLRGKVDFIAVSLHWGTDRSANVSRKNRELAHEIIDDGADMVLGGHTPYPKGIEAYHGKVIVYSPAHIFTGHQHFEWGDDYLLRFTLTPKSIEKVEVLPIAGTGMQLSQPFLLKDGPATKLLQTVRDLSVGLDTSMDIQDNEGVILPRETTQTEEQK